MASQNVFEREDVMLEIPTNAVLMSEVAEALTDTGVLEEDQVTPEVVKRVADYITDDVIELLNEKLFDALSEAVERVAREEEDWDEIVKTD